MSGSQLCALPNTGGLPFSGQRKTCKDAVSATNFLYGRRVVQHCNVKHCSVPCFVHGPSTAMLGPAIQWWCQPMWASLACSESDDCNVFLKCWLENISKGTFVYIIINNVLCSFLSYYGLVTVRQFFTSGLLQMFQFMVKGKQKSFVQWQLIAIDGNTNANITIYRTCSFYRLTLHSFQYIQ